MKRTDELGSGGGLDSMLHKYWSGRDVPLLYSKVFILSPETHGGLRIKEGGTSFAKSTPFMSILAEEINEAAMSFPVVFASDTLMPVVLLGLEQKDNLFVIDDSWDESVYLPAYVQRYPFALMATPDTQQFVLVADSACEFFELGGQAGKKLFEGGVPSDITNQALQFCEAWHVGQVETRSFVSALNERELLVDRVFTTTINGQSLGVDGFKVIDPETLNGLPSEVICAWQRNGWLSYIYAHLTSLTNFQDLIRRQSKRV